MGQAKKISIDKEHTFDIIFVKNTNYHKNYKQKQI